jgi:hypothetical protein
MRFTKRQWSILAFVFVLLLTGAGLRFFRGSPQLSKVKRMREELFSSSASQATPEERRAKMNAFSKEQEKLSPSERKEVWADARRAREKELERYAKLSQEDKAAYLDQRIDRMEAARQSANAANTPRFGNQGNRTPLSPDERERLRKERLDSTTPEYRALRDQFFHDMAARRAQRGLGNPAWGSMGPR